MIEVSSYLEFDDELVSIYNLDKKVVTEADTYRIDGGIDLLIDRKSALNLDRVPICAFWWTLVNGIECVSKRRSGSDSFPEAGVGMKVLSNNETTIDILMTDEWDNSTTRFRVFRQEWLDVLYPAAIDFFRIMARINPKNEDDHRGELHRLNLLRPLIYPRDYWTSNTVT